MMQPVVRATAIALSCAALAAANPVVTTTGVGARSYGMGNNFVALANDFSAVYWNPAGLAFQPVRELNVSIMGLRSQALSDLAGARTTTTSQRVRIASAGWLRSLPTTRGGFSFALGFATPFIFDDQLKASGSDVYLGTDSDYGGYGAAVNYTNLDRLSYGQLDNWTGAVGWQIAPGLGVGLSAALVTGSEERSIKTAAEYSGARGRSIENSETRLSIGYIGYDVRMGMLYQPNGIVSVGLRMDLPRSLWASEIEQVFDYLSVAQLSDMRYQYRLESPTAGAVGVAFKLPAMTASADVSARTPLPDQREGSTLGHWNVGAGAGVEIPIKAASSILRLGYGWQQFELYSMVEHGIVSDDPLITVDRDRHLFTGGLSVIISSVAIEAAYGYSLWGFSSRNASYQNALAEDHGQHRFLLSFALHY